MNELLNIVNERYEYSEELKGLIHKIWYNGLPKDKVGTRVGTKSSKVKYTTLSINGVHYREHQLVWLIHHGELVVGTKDKCIDHINGDTKDNRISNLRVVNQRVNCRNRVNSSGNVQQTPSGTYAAYIDIDKRIHLGSFKEEKHAKAIIKLLGSIPSKDKALELKALFKGGAIKNYSKCKELLDVL